MTLRNPKDFWTGIIYIAIGAAFIVIGLDYKMGTAVKMGPAYFPTVLSVLLVLIGLISFVRSFVHPGSPVGGITLRGLLIVVSATVLFGLLLRRGGLAVALPLFVIISASASSHFRWKPALLLAGGLTAFCWLVFLKGLGIPIPLLGSWFGG